MDDGPERIGSYRVESRLGRGGMGEVFLAWDDRLKRRVAIKRIRRDAETLPTIRERFLREAQAAAGLNHPAIVQVYDLLADETGDAIVMEYVEGRTLADRLAEGPLDLREALRLAREIAQGLTTAHASGLLHRDLKAENVIVTPRGHAKILDFGLSRPLVQGEGEETLTRQGALLGTLHAMSPEQAAGEEVDARSDLFSLGALLYEMVTGRAPFRGANPVDTLRRVLSHHPPPLRAVRPDVSPHLSAYVERLLAKERESRPASAREVVWALADLAAEETAAPVETESVSDLTTGTIPIRSTVVEALPRPPSAPASTAGMSVSSRKLHPAVLVVLLLIVLALGTTYVMSRHPRQALRVAVPMPEVPADAGEPLRLAASGVQTASLSALASLQGVAPVDPKEVDPKKVKAAGTSAMEMARAAATDEVLLSKVESEGGAARVTLRRVQGSDGQVLGTQSFEVTTNPGSARLLADAVALYLRKAYSDHPLRPGTPALVVRDGDYPAFLTIKRSIEEGTQATEGDLRKLEAITRSSPQFLEAKVLAAEVSVTLLQSERKIHYLNRALQILEQAERLAPEDPRPLKVRFNAFLASDQPEQAEKVLARLAGILPGDPLLLLLRARLALARGETESAITHLKAAVAQTPSWLTLWELADLEQRIGRTDDAREHLRALLDRSPGNAWGRESLANLELFSGDLKRAEQIYRGLLETGTKRPWLTNLGLTRFLLGDYAGAVEAYQKALALDPGHLLVRFNLADAELARGNRPAALAHYSGVLEGLKENQAAAGLTPGDRMLQAQCLAHLGQKVEAAEIAQETLQQHPDQSGLIYSAALVSAVIGDENAALANARRALELGTQPRWFQVPAFARLRKDPRLSRLLQAAAR